MARLATDHFYVPYDFTLTHIYNIITLMELILFKIKQKKFRIFCFSLRHKNSPSLDGLFCAISYLGIGML